MNPRNKLWIKRIVLGFAGLMVAYFLASFAVFDTLRESSDKEAKLQKELKELEKYNAREKKLKRRLVEYVGNTYGTTDETTVAQDVKVRVNAMIQASGMVCPTSSTSKGKSERKTFEELTYKCNLSGTLDQAVDLLAILRADPYRHRIDSMTIKLTRDWGAVEMDLNYSTPIPILMKGEKYVVNQPKGTEVISELDQIPHRQAYQKIASRNLFRPYAKKKPKPTPAPTRQAAPPTQTTTVKKSAPDPGDKLRLVDLSKYNGKQSVMVQDIGKNEYKKLKVGDDIADVKIVAVDTRPLPRQDDPKLMTYSRIIVQIGNKYYAVELGSLLSNRRLIPPSEIPGLIREK
jgi:hypothetical protein